MAERLDRERKRPGLSERERKALDEWKEEIGRETARRDAVTRLPERSLAAAKAVAAADGPPGPEDAVTMAAGALVAEGRSMLASPEHAPHLDHQEGLRKRAESGLDSLEAALADSDAERTLAEWQALEAQAVAEGASPFLAEESEELLARIEALAGDGRVPAPRRESLDRILADHAGHVRDRELGAIGDACRSQRARAERGGVSVAVRPGAGAVLKRIGEFAERHPGALPEPLAGFAGECGARLRELGDRLDGAGAGIVQAVRERDGALAGIERDWRSRRAKAAMQHRDIAFLPGTEALLWRTREFEERHPGVLPKATADLARDCESVQHRWERFGHALKEIADCAETSQPPGEATCKAMAEAEGILADDRLSARLLDTGRLLPVQDLLAELNERRAAADRILDLRKDLGKIEAEAERQGCHPFHVAGYGRFVERLAGSPDALPPDLAGMVDGLPGLEARDRGIRHRVREVTDFEARRRRIVERAARWRPETPLGTSMASSYGRWARSAPKVIERGETLARDPLISPEDRKALERAAARIRDTLDACGLEARHLRTWEGILDRAEREGCHRYFVKGYGDWVRGLGRRAIVAPGGNAFAIRERAVRDEMRGREAWVERIDKDLAKAVAEREDGGEPFVSEMHPYARWQDHATQHVGRLNRILDDRESYGPHLDRVPGMERRMREAAATITETVTRDAPVRKEVEAAYKVQMEREKEARQRELELERRQGPSHSMSAEIDYGR